MDYDTVLLKRITDFLHTIGIVVIEKELGDDTFLPGLQLKGNSILVDSKKLKYPGDLLHEAGHIAVTEERLRPAIGSVEMGSNWPTDGDELAAILWSYAALCFLQLDPAVVFHPNGYKDDSEWLIEQFRNKNYIGLSLLEWMGFCSDTVVFPELKKWLR